MHATSAAFVGAIAAAATLTSAGSVFVDNRCGFPLYEYSYVGYPQPAGVQGRPLPANTDTAYTETEFPADNNVPPNQIALSLSPNMTLPMQFSYDQNESGLTFYSFNTTDGDPIYSYGYEVITNGQNPSHGSVACPPSPTSGSCTNAFRPSFPTGTTDAPAPVFSVGNGADFTVRLCYYEDA